MSTAGYHYPGDPTPESRFFLPDDRCPHPEWWSATDADSTEIEVTALIAGLVEGLQPEVVIETGTAFAQTTVAIGHVLMLNGHGWLDSFEVDQGRIPAALKLCQHLPVTIHPYSSLEYVHDEGAGIIEFAFFNSHYELRVPEFRHFNQWMRSGTVVAFHDSAPGHGLNRIASGRDLHSEIVHELGDALDLVRFPTPRGLTLGVVR